MTKKAKRDLLNIVRGANQQRIARDVRNKFGNKTVQYNPEIVNEGKLWYYINFFKMGESFDDLPEEKRNNTSFLKGIELAATSHNREQEAYDDGMQKKIDGFKFKELSTFQQSNKPFLQGYQDAYDQSLIDGVDWTVVPDEDDVRMFKYGQKCFYDGTSIENLPDYVKFNTYFINGFMRAKNDSEKNMEDYDRGMQKFIERASYKDINNIIKGTSSFIRGYQDARDQSLVDGIDWRNIPDAFELDSDTSTHSRTRK